MDLALTYQEERLRIPRTAAYYMGFLCLGLMDASLGPTLPWLADRVGITVGAAGILFTLRAAGYSIGSLAIGRLYDRLPGHRLMALGLVVVAVALAATPNVRLPYALGAAMLAAGAGAGMLDVGSNTLLAWIHGARVAPFMNGLHLFFGVGALISPMIIAQAFAHGFGPQWAYWATTAVVIVVMLWIGALKSPPVRVRDSLPEPVPVSPIVADVPAPPASRVPSERLFVAFVAAALAAYVGLELGFGGWAFTYGVNRAGLSKAGAAYLTSVYWGAFTTGRLLSIPVLARLGQLNERKHGAHWAAIRTPRQALYGSLGGATVALVVLFTSVGQSARSAAAANTTGGPLLWIGGALLGFVIGPIFPTLISLAEARIKLTGGMTSLFLVTAGLGAMFIPWSIGVTMQRFGAGALIPALVAAHLVLVVLVAALGPWLGGEVSGARRRGAL